MVDRKLGVLLTADGSDLQRGLAAAAAAVQQFGATTSTAMAQAAAATGSLTMAANQAAIAQQAQETAASRFLSSLEREITMVGKTRDQQLELRAAMLGIAQAADPLIHQWREVTAAAQAAANAEKQAADGAAFVASLNSRANAIGKTSSQLLEMKAAEMGVSAQAAPFIARLRDSEQVIAKTGVSVGQTAQAMRMLPAQLTDVVTSLQGGQNPFTVLLQQGGQTKDMFGGFGAMFAGIGAALTPMVVAVGAAGIAVGALGYAFVSGAQESEAMRTSIIATGHSAGKSAGEMQDLAGQIGKATGEFGTARDAAQQLAATGRISGHQIEVALEGVVAGTKVTGQAVSDLVGDFVKLGESPSKAITDLNEKYHFLTATTYEQIAALEQQGRTTESAALAQQTYADALKSRSGEIVENIGLFARAWRMAKADAAEAWDAFLNVGRTKSLATEISEQIDAVDKFQKQYANARATGNSLLADRSLADLNTARAELLAKQEKSAAEFISTRSKAESALAEQRAIDGQRRLGQLDLEINKSKALSAALLKNKADEAAIREKNPNSELITPDAIALREKKEREKYADKGAISAANSAAQNAISGQMAALQAQAKLEQDALKTSLEEQKKLRETGAIDQQTYYDDIYVLRDMSLKKQLGLAQKESEAAEGKTNLAAREAAKGKVAKIQQEIEANEATHLSNVQGIRDQYKADFGQQIAQWGEQKRASQDALETENAMFGKTDAQRRIATAGIKVEADARKFLADQKRKGITLSEEDLAQLKQETAERKKAAEQEAADAMAASGAQTLYDQNRQFAADSILDEREAAAARVQIERDKWQALLDAATAGSDQQRNLARQLQQFDANEAARPQIEAQKKAQREMVGDWSETIDNVGSTFRTGFADMMNGGKDTWSAFTKSLSTTFKTTVIDMLYKEFAKPIVVSVLANMAGFLTGNSSTTNSILAANGGGSSWINQLSSANSGSNYINAGIQAYGGFSTGASTASLAYANGVGFLGGGSGLGTLGGAAGSLGGDSLGALISANGGWAGVPVAAGISSAGAALGGSIAATTATTTAAGTALGTGALGTSVLGAAGTTGLTSVTGAALGSAATGITATGVGVAAGGTVAGTTGAAALAGGAGAGAGMTAAAMIPYIGWAIAAMAVLSTMIGSDKTPAVGGNAFTQIGAEGTVAADDEETKSRFFGDDRGYKGPSAGLTTGMAALGDQIAATAKLYGGDATGLQLYAQTAQSPDGQGASGGTALYDKDGTQIFGSQFEGTNEELEANVALSMKRALLGGLKAADLAPEFANVFKGYGENLGTLSEEQVTSITAALEGVRAMNTAFDALSITFPKLADMGWEVRTGLVNASGGLENWNTNLASYYGNFTSESDRMANTFEAMTETVTGLGLEMPTTEAGFKSLTDGLIDGLTATDTAGQQTVATMLGMSSTFKTWADYNVAAAKAVQDKADEAAAVQLKVVDTMKSAYSDYLTYLQQEVDKSRSDVQEAYDRESGALQATIEATKSYIKSLADLRSSLLLGDLSTLSPEQKYAQGRTDLDALIAKADGGDAEAQAAVPQAIQQFLELSRSYNASTEAYQRDFSQYLDTAERMRTTAASQLDIQQSQLARMNALVSGVLDINKSVLSLSDALKEYAAALATKGGTSQFAPGTPTGLTAVEQAINAAYLASDGRNADAEGLAFWRDAILAGADQASILAQIQAINKSSVYDGSHATGLDYVPFDGYIAQVHKGERIKTAAQARAEDRMYSAPMSTSAQGSSSRDSAEVVVELRAVQTKLDRAEARSARLMETLIGLTSAASQQQSREMSEQTGALRNRNSTLIPA